MLCTHLLYLTELMISFNGWGVTRDDSLDTMLLMNLTDMFDRAMLGVKELTFEMKEVRGLFILRPALC